MVRKARKKKGGGPFMDKMTQGASQWKQGAIAAKRKTEVGWGQTKAGITEATQSYKDEKARRQSAGWPKMKMPQTTFTRDRTTEIDPLCNKNGVPRPGWKMVKGHGLAESRCQHYSERASVFHDPFAAAGLAWDKKRAEYDPTYSRYERRGGKRKTKRRRKRKKTKRRKTKRRKTKPRRTRRRR